MSFSDDYFVITKAQGRPRAWAWEIRRRSKPIGVRLNGNGFKSEFAAKLAGEKALKAPRTIAGFGDSAFAERTSAGLVPR